MPEELHILKVRMLERRRAKARRGELGKPVPMGYSRRPSGAVHDEQVQDTIRKVFERFRTVGKVMRYLSSTRSGCRCERSAALENGSSNGAAPTGPRYTICLAIRSMPMASWRPTGDARSQDVLARVDVRRTPRKLRCSCRIGSRSEPMPRKAVSRLGLGCQHKLLANNSGAITRNWAPTGQIISAWYELAVRCCRAC